MPGRAAMTAGIAVMAGIGSDGQPEHDEVVDGLRPRKSGGGSKLSVLLIVGRPSTVTV